MKSSPHKDLSDAEVNQAGMILLSQENRRLKERLSQAWHLVLENIEPNGELRMDEHWTRALYKLLEEGQ